MQTDAIFNYSEVESKRFDLRIFRAVMPTIQEKELVLHIVQNEVDLLILRIPSTKLSQVTHLERTGFPYLVADTLVYYSVDLHQYTPQAMKNSDLEFVPITPDQIGGLYEIVAGTFNDYTNHYYSNPFLPRDKILEGYKEWAGAYVDGTSDGRIAWFVKRSGLNIGFATCSFDLETGHSEGVLYAVDSSAAGGGVYGDIIRFTQSFFKSMGISIMKVSTQVQNFAVQKVWAREGFVLTAAYNTIHINSFLHQSQIERKEIEVVISESDIRRCTDFCGDDNLLHFDDSFAQTRGFNGRIAHGLIINGLISKYFGAEFPGHGTIFMGYAYKFFKPLYPNEPYLLQVSFPFIDQRTGFSKAIVQVKNKTKELCLISYNDIYQRLRL